MPRSRAARPSVDSARGLTRGRLTRGIVGGVTIGVTIGVGLLGAVLGDGTAAVAATVDDDVLLVSEDGATFTAGATWRLFPGAGSVVPSDVIRDDVWLQSAADSPGRVQIRLDDLRANDADLVDAMTVWVTVSGFDDVPVSVGDVRDGCVVLHSGLELQPGETARVSASVAIDPALGERPGDAGDAGAGATVDFVLRAVLSDLSAPDDTAPGSACHTLPAPSPVPSSTPAPAPTDHGLPATGAPVPLSALGLGIVGAATGFALLWLTRRRHTERRHHGIVENGH